jgi:hypothetical protein
VLPLLERVSDRQKQRILFCQRSNELLWSAVIALAQGQLERATVECRQALLLNPDNPDAKYVFGQIGLPLDRRRPHAPDQSNP